MGDWLATFLAIALVLLGVVFAWIFAGETRHGELMAGIVTGCAVVFSFHAITETSGLRQTDFAASWRQTHSGPRERAARVASR